MHLQNCGEKELRIMRLFTAVLPDDAYRQELESIQDMMKEYGAAGRYTESANLHLTLVFIGEYGNPDRIMDILRDIPAEPVSLKPLRIEKLHDMYILRFAENAELNTIVKRIRRAFAENGIPFDGKSFLPHITLVRKVQKDLKQYLEVPSAELVCDSVSLMRSAQGRNGSVYTEMGYTEFGGETEN